VAIPSAMVNLVNLIGLRHAWESSKHILGCVYEDL
jgi:hypothetical protein